MRIALICFGVLALMNFGYATEISKVFHPRSGPEGGCGKPCSDTHPCDKIERPEYDEAGHCECIPEPECGATIEQHERALRKLEGQ